MDCQVVNFYNDNDLKACAWTSALVENGLIAPGDVVCKSILDITPEDLDDRYTQLHFFNGVSGWPRALDLAGFPRGRHIWTASLPCQPWSVAGSKKAQKDERHLWPTFFELVKARRPVLVIGEQVRNAIGFGWTDGIFEDLEGQNYTCGQIVLGAHSVGAPHVRQRLYWVAIAKDGLADAHGRHASPEGLQRGWEHGQRPPDDRAGGGVAITEGGGLGADGGTQGEGGHAKQCLEVGRFWDNDEGLKCNDGRIRRIPSQDIQASEPVLQCLVDGLPEGLDLCGADRSFPLIDTLPQRAGLLRGMGNAIVPPLAAVFVRAVMEELGL